MFNLDKPIKKENFINSLFIAIVVGAIFFAIVYLSLSSAIQKVRDDDVANRANMQSQIDDIKVELEVMKRTQ